ncbi:uncharacterized protein LOC120373503 isoform X1 [Mauremys reevesii]|uniref:uncharacterized protein LOC120373503 isoform X1 n=1 Tax=Mauremys reevesii TaxID=260615 RepID=UPI001940102C|nr:uncharacterized protein LOC120373503 isoform X1 [Mauremys reevesii]
MECHAHALVYQVPPALCPLSSFLLTTPRGEGGRVTEWTRATHLEGQVATGGTHQLETVLHLILQPALDEPIVKIRIDLDLPGPQTPVETAKALAAEAARIASSPTEAYTTPAQVTAGGTHQIKAPLHLFLRPALDEPVVEILEDLDPSTSQTPDRAAKTLAAGSAGPASMQTAVYACPASKGWPECPLIHAASHQSALKRNHSHRNGGPG